MKVRTLPSGREFEAQGDEAVLHAALRHHLNLPHSCKGGSCGSCRSRLISGSFRYPHGRPPGISAEEAAAGYVLICQARALEDLVVEIREIHHVTDVEIKCLPARIERMRLLAPDVMGLWLRLPAIEPFRWQCGQYLDILLPGERRRSFSLANPPHDAALLELHVRRARGGAFSEQVFTELAPGALLRVEGPLGQFICESGDRPLLLIGGGTGYAPLKAMIRHALETSGDREITLFWGARTAADLYEDAWLREQSAKHARFEYVSVLSEQAATGLHESGLVHESVLRRFADLGAFDIYAAGPPAMIDAVRTSLPAHGADPDRIRIDSFDYAPP